MPLLVLEEVAAPRGRDCLAARADLELAQHGRHVVVDGAWREEESPRDLGVSKAVRDELEHLRLSSRGRGTLPRGTSRASYDPADTALAQPARDALRASSLTLAG